MIYYKLKKTSRKIYNNKLDEFKILIFTNNKFIDKKKIFASYIIFEKLFVKHLVSAVVFSLKSKNKETLSLVNPKIGL